MRRADGQPAEAFAEFLRASWLAAKPRAQAAVWYAEAWLIAVTNDPLLPEKNLPSGYLGRPAWRRRIEVSRAAGRQLRTFNRP